VFPRRLPNLYAGQPLVVLARLGSTAGLVTLAGRSGSGYWLRQQPLSVEHAPGVAQLWARAAIESGLDGAGSGAPRKVRDQVLSLGLGYGLLTPFTALLAVDKSPSRPAHSESLQHALPVLLPHGQSGQAIFGFPQTAAGMWLKLLLGAIAMAISGGLFWGAAWGVVPR
jgi:Ca-activated chloride channel family protein